MLEVNRKKLQEDLVLARRFLNEAPYSTKNLERVDRCLYWLGEPEASGYLAAAAHAYDILEEDLEEAQRLWARVGSVDCLRLRAVRGKENIATNKPGLPTGVSPRSYPAG